MHDFQIVCTCRSFQPRYTGNLNFVKGALAGAARLDAGKLDVVLNNCSQLHLELNFHTLGRRPIDLRIENSGSVRVVQVAMVTLTLMVTPWCRSTWRLGTSSRLGWTGFPMCRGSPCVMWTSWFCRGRSPVTCALYQLCFQPNLLSTCLCIKACSSLSF